MLLAAGDFHGADLTGLSKTILDILPDIYISLGDYDTVECILQHSELEKKLKERGTMVVSVPGNHDAAIYSGMDLFSPYSSDNCDDFMKNPGAWGYLENLVARPSQSLDVFGRQAIIVHGGLAGDVDWSVPKKDRILWYRMNEREDIEDNFLKMQELGYSLMIKGHGHSPVLYTYDKEVSLKTGWGNEEYNLEYSMLIINPGAFAMGYYCLIEDNSVKFRKN